METVTLSDKTQDQNIKNKKKFKKNIIYTVVCLLIFLTGIGVGILISNYIKAEQETEQVPEVAGEQSPYLADDPIRSPLNGVIIEEPDYERLIKNIPHAVMISNNESARDEQYGLTYADIVYEAETEGAITRFMAIFWSNQEDYIIKPVRSVRKYFLDWAVEYGNIPVTFSGFAQTNNPDTDSWGFYKENDIRVTYFDWPLKWDNECLLTHPTMHCKSTTPETLYELFANKEWSYDSWINFKNKSEWLFEENLENKESYEEAQEFVYDFTYRNAWSSRWKYDFDKKVYLKYDPEEEHIDINDKKQIEASTVIIQITDRSYTGDDKGRVAYSTVGSGDAYIMRDGIKIEGAWKKECHKCRTNYFSRETPNRVIAFRPGVIWISAVPSDKEIEWK